MFAEFSNLSATAVLVWWVWWQTTRAQPRMMAMFGRELAAQRCEHRWDREAFLEAVRRSTCPLVRAAELTDKGRGE